MCGKCIVLAGQNFFKKRNAQARKVPKSQLTGQVFINFKVQKSSLFSKLRPLFFTLLSNVTHFLLEMAKNLMPRQHLPTES